MTNFDKKELTNFARDVLISSGEIAKKHFNMIDSGKNIDSDIKSDGSVVTVADKEIEEFIRKKIKEKYPNHSIYGEEFGGQDKLDNEFCWVIDPIDGTASFAAGRPIFGIMLGLVNNGEPVLGAVYQPITDELWLGVDGETTLNGEPAQARKANKHDLTIATTSLDLLDDKGKEYWGDLELSAANVIYGGDCYNYCLLASGKIDIVFEQGLKPYDFIPLIPILKGAGANVSDLSGNKIDINSIATEFFVRKD